MDPTMILDVLHALSPLKNALPVLGPAVGVLAYLSARARSNREEARKLRTVAYAIDNAVVSTEAYVEHLGTGGRMPDREHEIAKLWTTAGTELGIVAVTEQERVLANKLKDKGLAWDYILQWPEERVEERGIDFATVRAELAELKRITSAAA